MNLKSLLAKPFANAIYNKTQKGMMLAIQHQQQILKALLKTGSTTQFGKAHQMAQVSDHQGFVQAVPIRDYEQIKPYIELIKQGKENILWKGKPLYFAKTSGTTSGAKYIPITKASIPNHITTARNALFCYMAETGNTAFANGKMIFLSGSPVLERTGNIPTGRLSGIVNHHIPSYLRSNQLPTYETNCIEDWESKLDKIVEETLLKDMTLISGIPPWMQMYFDRLREKSGKNIGDIFPNFSVMVQGGVNFEPYKNRIFQSIGRKIDTIELFPASEGFFAFQDSQMAEGMLLNTNSGIYFEFVPADEIFNEFPSRLPLEKVILGVNYALIVNSNAGLWGYNIGDTVKFVSLNPYRIIVTGRTKHFISAFGEHVIGEEVEAALRATLAQYPAKITEFSIAPMVQQGEGKSYHEWFIEFDEMPQQTIAFGEALNHNMCLKNSYYSDLIQGNILMPLKITLVQKNGFVNYMKLIGKLGGQNKVPRLSNDRKLADKMATFIKS